MYMKRKKIHGVRSLMTFDDDDTEGKTTEKN